MNENKKEFAPAIVVTSENWSQITCVVSYDDEWFPPEWVAERRDELQREAEECGDKTAIDYDTVESEMNAEFENDNEIVDEFWPEHEILSTKNGCYYRYDTDHGSWAKYLGDYESLNECLDDNQ